MAEKRRFINNTDIGQNFLIDESVVAYTVKRAAVTPDDVILEIGPGGGILTRGLLSAGPRALCAVEVDERLRDGLEALASRDGRLRLFWGDAVRFDYRAELPETPTKIVANLPYHITTPILWAFLEKLIPAGVGYMLLMVQLESAERIASPERSRARAARVSRAHSVARAFARALAARRHRRGEGRRGNSAQGPASGLPPAAARQLRSHRDKDRQEPRACERPHMARAARALLHAAAQDARQQLDGGLRGYRPRTRARNSRRARPFRDGARRGASA